MRSHFCRVTAASIFALSMSMTSGVGVAQTVTSDFQKAVQAFESGKYSEAVALWEPLAEGGNVEAMRNLAQLYRLGLGVPQDDTKAFELYEKAAERGLPEAQVNLAFQLLTGKGVEEDRRAAATWFGKAADKGNALAQYNLGLMYERGIGVKQSHELARELYEAAAEQGQKRAIVRLEALEEAMAANSEATGDSQQSKKEQDKKPRPNKADIAADIAAQNAKKNDSKPGDLSIIPNETVKRKFEENNTQEQAKIPAYKSEAQNGVRADENSMQSEVIGVKELFPTKIPSKKPSNRTPASHESVAVPSSTRTTGDQSFGPITSIKMAEAAYRRGEFTKAANLLEPLASRGMPVAQFWMGRLHNRGEGVELDRTAAYVLWRSAAASGSQSAATALANLTARLSPDEIRMAEQRYAAMIQ